MPTPQPGPAPTLPRSLAQIHVVHADVRELEPGGYDLASMHFVAEGATEDFAEFAEFCPAYVRCVAPGGWLVAAFMENLPTYRIGPASRWLGCPVDPETVTEVFAPLTRELTVTHIDPDPTLPDYGDSGMVLLTATARQRDCGGATGAYDPELRSRPGLGSARVIVRPCAGAQAPPGSLRRGFPSFGRALSGWAECGSGGGVRRRPG